jgi:hypothetical protein
MRYEKEDKKIKYSSAREVTDATIPCCPYGNHSQLPEEASVVLLIVLRETVL